MTAANISKRTKQKAHMLFMNLFRKILCDMSCTAKIMKAMMNINTIIMLRTILVNNFPKKTLCTSISQPQ